MCNELGVNEGLYKLIQEGEAGDYDAKLDAIKYIESEELFLNDPLNSRLAEIRFSFMRQIVDEDEAEGAKADEDVLINLGLAYEYGVGVRPNAEEAIHCYQKAVEQGDISGNEHLGSLYLQGHGVPVDYEKAFRYLTMNDELRYELSNYLLGEMYRQGLGVSKDEEVACRYFEVITKDISSEISVLDNVSWRSCFRLGVAKHYGRGTQRDLVEALRLLNKANELYDNSQGFPLDLINDITEEELNHEWKLINQEAGGSR